MDDRNSPYYFGPHPWDEKETPQDVDQTQRERSGVVEEEQERESQLGPKVTLWWKISGQFNRFRDIPGIIWGKIIEKKV